MKKKLKNIFMPIIFAVGIVCAVYGAGVIGIRLYNLDKFLSTGGILGKCAIKCNNAYRIDFDRPECVCSDGKVYRWEDL